MRVFFFLVFFMSSITVMAGGQYPVSDIPESLLKNANVVKRLDEVRFTFKSVGKATEYHHFVYTILNEKGDGFASVAEAYSKLQSIESIDGTLYDVNGSKIRSLKKSDIKDLSGTGESLVDDIRVKAHNFYHKIYPYTIEYTISIDHYNTMFLPDWRPVNDEKVSIQKGVFKVVFPADYTMRYRAFNLANPAEQSGSGEKTMTWEIKNFAAIEDEYQSPPLYELTPSVFLAPTAFEIHGYAGDMTTWESFGKFSKVLLEGRDQLPADVKTKVHELTDAVTDTKEKIKILYNYLQKNTRYISIQLGIGGWQPFDATYVATKKYGDCKALSNFMGALLKEAGIKSYYTVIKAGTNATDFLHDFPSSQFNHVILCAIDKSDSLWLECTSQDAPAGYMGRFTGGRYALMITENGGKLVKTPSYNFKDNREVRHINAVVSESGDLAIDVVSTYKACQQDELHGKINSLSKQKVLDILKEEIDLPQYDVIKYDYKEESSAMPVVTEVLSLTATSYAQVSGKRLFIAPNILTKLYTKLQTTDTRKSDVVLKYEYTDVDTVEIKVPAGYKPESMPAPVVLESKFGKYSCSVKIADDKITYYRHIERYSGRFPAKEYNELAKFYEQVYKADRSKVVLVRQ